MSAWNWKDGTKVTFDLDGRLNRGGTIGVGCQLFTVEEVVKAGGKVSINDGVVRVTGLVGTVNEAGKVAFEGTDKTFSKFNVEDYGRDLRVEEPKPPAPPAPEWIDGDSAFVGGGVGQTVVRGDDKWLTPGGGMWAGGDKWLDWYTTDPVTVLVKGGKVVAGQPVVVDPATLSWQEGDIAEVFNHERRYLQRGDKGLAWYDDDGRKRMGFGDSHDDNFANTEYTPIRKGGVDLPAAA